MAHIPVTLVRAIISSKRVISKQSRSHSPNFSEEKCSKICVFDILRRYSVLSTLPSCSAISIYIYDSITSCTPSICSWHVVLRKLSTQTCAPTTTNRTNSVIKSRVWRDIVKWNYPRIEEPTTSKTSHSRLSNTPVVKSTATNTEMNTFVRGA